MSANPGAAEMPYAVVVVDTPLQRRVSAQADDASSSAPDPDYLTRGFHYLIPEAWRGRVGVGQLVWVPFGARRLQGVVVELAADSPVAETRPLAEVADPDPVLTPTQIELAYWISRHYLAPIQSVVAGMLPPGVTQKAETVYRLAEADVPETASSTPEAAVLALLGEFGEQTPNELGAAGIRGWRGAVDRLAADGRVVKITVVRPPQVRPKMTPVVRAVDGAALEMLPRRAARQRDALDYLLARRETGDWLPVSEVSAASGASSAAVRALAEKGLAEQSARQVWRDPLAGREFVAAVPPRLTPDQEAVWARVAADLDAPTGRPMLLQGVTGSGKTEIYLRAVARVLRQGRSAIVLVPEIALTPQTIRRFGARFADTIAVMHSRLSPGERYDQWRRLRAGELRLVVGSRSAVFAPMRDLGLVVVDEEHETSYKQERTPRYHARDVAVQLARLSGATCILGSATPDLDTAHRAAMGEYAHLSMPRRVMGHRHVVEEQAARLHRPQSRYLAAEAAEEAMFTDLPPVEIVDMRAELRAGNTAIFSRPLRRAMEAALAAGEQIILFLNRRGAASFIMCRDCGHVIKCPRCDVPLTYHSTEGGLVCHHCNYRAPLPTQCPECWSHRIRQFGIGTQRVEELVREAFPAARVVRWDLDTTGGKTSHEELLDRFIRGEADIMVGTQMIAKGLDLPRVTLVGVITADTVINLPDFRAGERTFQLLTQVAGRAGRSVLGGQVVIQTYTPQHPAIQAARTHDYEAFYESEIAFRREQWYPPVSRLVRLIYSHANGGRARAEAERLHRQLELRIAQEGLPEVNLIGPAPAFFARLRGKSRWQILVRGTTPADLIRDLHLPLGWQIDVDPVSLL